MKRRQNNFIKGEAAAESSVWKMLLPSFLGIIVCTICLAGMTWAWFTSGVQSQSTVTAKEYALNETIRVKDAGSEALAKSGEGTYALEADQEYVVTLKPDVTPKSGGYCMLKITSADGSEEVYYTKALTAKSEFSFKISNGDKAVTCQMIAAWGEPDASKTAVSQQAGKQANQQLIGSGDTIKINGGAPEVSTQQPAQDAGNSDSAKGTTNSDASKDAKDSSAPASGTQKDAGSSDATQKSDQETTGE